MNVPAELNLEEALRWIEVNANDQRRDVLYRLAVQKNERMNQSDLAVEERTAARNEYLQLMEIIRNE
jgi:hypothetical protein